MGRPVSRDCIIQGSGGAAFTGREESHSHILNLLRVDPTAFLSAENERCKETRDSRDFTSSWADGPALTERERLQEKQASFGG